MFAILRREARRLTEAHPYVWAAAWRAAHRLSFLLPHDPSYRGLVPLSDGDEGLFLDIGANDGISALSFRKLDAKTRILSFEPNPIHEPALRRLKGRIDRFDYRIIGLGEGASGATFYSPTWGGVQLHTFAASSADKVREGLTMSFGARIARQAAVNAFTAAIVDIDSLDLTPSLIKIDTEGFEVAVIKGATATLGRCRPAVLFEALNIDADALRAIFDDLDYATAVFDVGAQAFREIALARVPYGGNSHNVYAVPAERFAKLRR